MRVGGTAAVGKRHHPGWVVGLEHVLHEQADGVLAEVGGDVADAQGAAVQWAKRRAGGMLVEMERHPGKRAVATSGQPGPRSLKGGLGRQKKAVKAGTLADWR